MESRGESTYTVHSETDRTALVVGGSGGIGAAVARRLVALGWTVRVHGRDPERTRRVADALCRMGPGRAHPELFAIGDQPGEAERAADALVGPDAPSPAVPHLVVVAAGPFLEKPFRQTTEAEWRAMWELNCMLPVAIGRRVLEPMVERGYGRVVVFGGTGTHRISGYRTISAYSAAKTALISWVKSAARSVDRPMPGADEGETVNSSPARRQSVDVAVSAVCPGFVDTEYLTDEQRERYRRAAGGRLQAPDEIAEQVVALIDAPAAQSNGRVVAWEQKGTISAAPAGI